MPKPKKTIPIVSIFWVYNQKVSGWRNSWWVYSAGLFIVWTFVLLLVWRIDTRTQLKDVALIFCGYFLGWLSATIKMEIIKKSKSSN